VNGGGEKHKVPILVGENRRANYCFGCDWYEDQGGTNQEVPEPGDQGDRTCQAGVHARFIIGVDVEAVPGISCEPAISCLVLEKLRVCVRHLQEQGEDESGLDERKDVDDDPREDRDECFFHGDIFVLGRRQRMSLGWVNNQAYEEINVL